MRRYEKAGSAYACGAPFAPASFDYGLCQPLSIAVLRLPQGSNSTVAEPTVAARIVQGFCRSNPTMAESASP